MKWSKSKISVLAFAATLLITAVVFASPMKDTAGNLFNWYIGGVEKMRLDDETIQVNKVTDLAGTGSPNFTNGLNLSSEPTLVAEYMTATVATGTPAAGTFYSEIIGRAPILDPSKIPSGKFGVERITYDGHSLVVGERGPADEPVWTVFGDKMRIFGTLLDPPNQPLAGAHIHIVETSKAEIVFYGTGLNILGAYFSPNTRTYITEIDGVAGTTIDVGSYADDISQRTYQANIPTNVVSGLTVGVHTVTVEFTGSAHRISGIEILNEATTVAIPAGSIVDNGRKYTTTAITDDLTTFAVATQDGGSVTDATRGAAIVRYFDTDGTIKKNATYTNAAQANMGSANHQYEEIVQKINFRQFGTYRSDDFATLTDIGLSNRAFALDDGTTTLIVKDGNATAQLGFDAVRAGPTSGTYIKIMFVGTGLDLDIVSDNVGRNFNEVIIDGQASIGSITYAAPERRIEPIVSGLPYGTHTVKLFNNLSGTFNSPGLIDIIVYAPKKPVLTAGQVEIDSTYKVADHIVNTTQGDGPISQGVIVKSPSREQAYAGNWTFQAVNDVYQSGMRINADDLTAEVTTTFWGTGYEMRQGDGDTSTSQVIVDGLNFTTANFGSVATNAEANDFGGMVFTASTGLLQSGAGFGPNGGWGFNGLPLGTHTVKLDLTVFGGGLQFAGTSYITPTYNYKSNVLNTSDKFVGSNSIKNEILIPGATKNKIIALGGIESSIISNDVAGLVKASTITVPMGGVFTSGNVTISRVGNIVTATSQDVPEHPSSSNNISGVIIPAGLRPTSGITNIYFYGPSILCRIEAGSNGTFTTEYRDWAGSASAQTNTANPFSVSWAIPTNRPN